MKSYKICTWLILLQMFVSIGFSFIYPLMF
uniref:Uncharacterized protein n=1 Tax=Rhizophora mucronata TaxID=61149 RepID=A0A2P2PGM7_RHIMU